MKIMKMLKRCSWNFQRKKDKRYLSLENWLMQRNHISKVLWQTGRASMKNLIYSNNRGNVIVKPSMNTLIAKSSMRRWQIWTFQLWQLVKVITPLYLKVALTKIILLRLATLSKYIDKGWHRSKIKTLLSFQASKHPRIIRGKLQEI